MPKITNRKPKKSAPSAAPPAKPKAKAPPAQKKSTTVNVSEAGKALRFLGGAGGTALGSFFGVPPSIGASMGTAAGGMVSRLLGQGDYEVKTNSLIAPGASHLNSATVVMGPDGRRGVRIQDREYIGTILGSTVFTNTSYLINPANSATFPWLSSIAQSFDEWVPNGLAFSFKSTSAAFNGSNQALGVVIGACEYDVADPAYTNRLEMESSAYCVSGKAAEDFVHMIECDPDERGRAVLKTLASASTPPYTSAMDYHLGRFQVATEGQSAVGTVMGELWVSYDITFYKKQLFNGALGYNIPTVMAVWNSPTFLAATPFGNGVLPNTTKGNLAFEINTTGSKIRFPSLANGMYFVEYRALGSGITASSGATWTYTNCTNAAAFSGNTDYNEVLASITGTGLGRVTASTMIYITAASPVIQLNLGLVAGTVSNCYLFVTQINGSASMPTMTLTNATF